MKLRLLPESWTPPGAVSHDTELSAFFFSRKSAFFRDIGGHGVATFELKRTKVEYPRGVRAGVIRARDN